MEISQIPQTKLIILILNKALHLMLLLSASSAQPWAPGALPQAAVIMALTSAPTCP